MKKLYFCLLMLIASNACAMDSGNSGVFTRFDMMNKQSKGLGDLVPREDDSCVRASTAREHRDELKEVSLTRTLARVNNFTREDREKKEREEHEAGEAEKDQELKTERTHQLETWQTLHGKPYTTNVAFNNKGTLIAAGSHATNKDGTANRNGPSFLQVWRLHKDKGLNGLFLPDGSPQANDSCTYCLDFNPNNDKEIATGGWDGAMKVFRKEADVDGKYEQAQTQQLSEETGKEVIAIAFSPDGDVLAASSMNKKVYFLRRNNQTYTPVAVPLECARRVDAITFRSPQTLVLGMDDGTIQFCNKEHGTFTPVHRIDNEASNPGDWINSLTFNNGNNILAVCSNYSGVRLFEFGDDDYKYKLKQQLEGHEKGALALDFSSDDKKLISGSGDGRVFVWEKDKDGHYQRMSQTGPKQYEVAAVRCVPDGDPMIALLAKVQGTILLSRLQEKIRTTSSPRMQEEIKDGSGSSSPVGIHLINDEAGDSGSSVASE